MATDQIITEAIRSLFSETNLEPNVNSLNGVVELLQSKLGGLDLTDKLDFIGAQIHLLFPQQLQATNPNDNFALHQSTNSVPATPVAASDFQFFSAQPTQLPPTERFAFSRKKNRNFEEPAQTFYIYG